VTIDSTAFKPSAITVKLGESVVWVNNDPFPHTATSTGAVFDSKPIAAGKSWRFTPRAKGDFPYKCTLHPTMRGTLHVQ
jgi:plastocyanin